jgi:hypothetical protein
MTEYVYFVTRKGRNDEPIKIGWSYDIAARISQLERPLPFSLECVEYIEVVDGGAWVIESALHRHFKSKRIKGEWFDIRKDEIFPAAEIVSADLGCGVIEAFDHKGILPPPGREKASTDVTPARLVIEKDFGTRVRTILAKADQ